MAEAREIHREKMLVDLSSVVAAIMREKPQPGFHICYQILTHSPPTNPPFLYMIWMLRSQKNRILPYLNASLITTTEEK
jgi:hypothetical protein